MYNISKNRPYDRNSSRFYNRYCNKLKIEISETKNCYYARKINEAKGDLALQWKIVNTSSDSVSKKSVDRVEVNNGIVLSDPAIVADTVNSHRSTVCDSNNEPMPNIAC